MRHAKTKAMLAYWMELFQRAGNRPQGSELPIWPERGEVMPSECRTLLGDMFVLDVTGTRPRYRLAGTRLCSMHGRELRGEPFGTAMSAADEQAAESWATSLHDEECLLIASMTASTADGASVATETLLLPLNNQGASGERILGITVPCASPYWLGSDAIEAVTTRSFRTLRPWRDGVETTLPNLRRTVIAPPIAPRRVGHLTVLEGGLSRAE